VPLSAALVGVAIKAGMAGVAGPPRWPSSRTCLALFHCRLVLVQVGRPRGGCTDCTSGHCWCSASLPSCNSLPSQPSCAPRRKQGVRQGGMQGTRSGREVQGDSFGAVGRRLVLSCARRRKDTFRSDLQRRRAASTRARACPQGPAARARVRGRVLVRGRRRGHAGHVRLRHVRLHTHTHTRMHARLLYTAYIQPICSLYAAYMQPIYSLYIYSL